MQPSKINFSAWLVDSFSLAKDYWLSVDKYKASGLLFIVIICNLLQVYIAVQFNRWNNIFYDTIQHFNQKGFYQALITFVYIVISAIITNIVGFYAQKILEIRWRRFMTNEYLTRWFSKKAYYKTQFNLEYTDNPDQRISQDINSFISNSLDLSLGLLSNIVTLASFVTILWGLSGSLSFIFLGLKWQIPGYMVFFALIYALLGTLITFKIGRPLVKLNFRQENVEADFRFGLMRVREYGENIAFYRGEKEEQASLNHKFNLVVDNFIAIIYRNMKISVFNIFYSYIAMLFPLLVAAPRYFAKSIQLGGLMQIAQAFSQVQGALSFFINAYTSLASYRAVMDRLLGFKKAINQASALGGIAKKELKEAQLKVANLKLYLPSGELLLANINFELALGDHLLITGPSGVGKTTLLRALAGIWPYLQGKIYQNFSLSELFIAQKPYIPPQSLKAVLVYPRLTEEVNDNELIEVLKLVKLEFLISELTQIKSWAKVLSLGEQQRISFARILINQPQIIYLDEITSSLDEEMEAFLYQLLVQNLKNSIIISVAHRSQLKKYHNCELNL